MKEFKTDTHLQSAIQVQENVYFVVNALSGNSNVGLLVGTEVKRIRDIEQTPSKYWTGDYYTVMVECPNGETRKVCCDCLTSRKTDEYFVRQRKVFSEYRRPFIKKSSILLTQ